jgi:hypothetical protein
MHAVVVVALRHIIAFGLCTAVEVFGRIALPAGRPASRVLVCAIELVVIAGPARIAPDHGIEALAAEHRRDSRPQRTSRRKHRRWCESWLQIYADVMKR